MAAEILFDKDCLEAQRKGNTILFKKIRANSATAYFLIKYETDDCNAGTPEMK